MFAKFHNATITIHKTIILSTVNFTLHENQCVYLKGANGSGKTVFIETLLGFHKKVKGTHITNISDVCYIPDISFFSDDERIQDVLKAYMNFYNQSSDSISKALKRLSLNLQPKVKVATLSLGTKKKLELLPLFFNTYPLYILDEIFQGLDWDTVLIIVAQLKHHYDSGASILFTEHNQNIVEIINNAITNMEVYLCENQSLNKV